MPIYKVNLEKLETASLQAQKDRSLKVNWAAVTAYQAWVQDQLKSAKGVSWGLAGQVDKAIFDAMKRLSVVMPDGVDGYVEWVVTAIKALGMIDPITAPIIPIFNNELKSDAWLTGLVNAELALGFPQSSSPPFAFAVDRNFNSYSRVSVPKPIVQGPCKIVLIDDGSYSGIQATGVVLNAAAANLYDKTKVTRFWVILAGVSDQAEEYFERTWKDNAESLAPHPKPELVAYRTIPGGDFGSPEVIRAMEGLPYDPANVTVPPNLPGRLGKTGWYLTHCEVVQSKDPSKMELNWMAEQKSFPFEKVSYGVLPYKIPDSLSVPTHMLMACGYKNDRGRLNSWLPGWFGTKQPDTLPHLFKVSGLINYRETLANWNSAAGIGKNQSIFTEKLA